MGKKFVGSAKDLGVFPDTRRIGLALVHSLRYLRYLP